MGRTDDYQDLFLAEAADHLLSIVDGLLALESDAADHDAVESVFRAAHNLKSMAAAMGCDRTAQHVHRMESLMDSVRRGARPADRTLVDRMLRSVDEARRLIEVESGGELPAHLSGGPRDHLAGASSSPDPVVVPEAVVRVSVARIDELVGLAERLDDAVVRISTVEGQHVDPVLADDIAELREVAATLHREVMLTRTVAVGDLFRRYPRMVRDLGRELGKDVALQLEGMDVELDRAVVDRIADPIAHLLRNAVDHGVERPADRVTAGKPTRGTVRLSAMRSGGFATITISDDGAGIDVETIWAEAVKRGMVDPAERPHYGDEEVRLLCCRSGLTTVHTPTQVSGHGIGLDVVAGALRAVGGTLSVRSVRGRGTNFAMRLPLWLGQSGPASSLPSLFEPE